MTQMMIDSKAPVFSAADQTGRIRQLKDYAGRWLLLFFYPKDFTPGCTTESCTIRDRHDELNAHVTVIGVSKDSVDSHRRFIKKHKLPFALLSDSDGIMAKAFGANGVLFPKRVSFLIDPHGNIVKIYEKVKPSEHADEILRDIDLFIHQKPPSS